MKFLRISKQNFYKYEKYIISSEKHFYSKIRTPKKEYRNIFNDDTSLTYLLFYKNNYVGNITGYAQNKKSFYLFSIIVLPRYRGKGFGKILLRRFIDSIKKRGYIYLKGHFNFKSQKLVIPYNPILIKNEKRWEGTQEEYKYLRINV